MSAPLFANTTATLDPVAAKGVPDPLEREIRKIFIETNNREIIGARVLPNINVVCLAEV